MKKVYRFHPNEEDSGHLCSGTSHAFALKKDRFNRITKVFWLGELHREKSMIDKSIA